MIDLFFERLDLTSMDSKIYQELYKIGVQPASIVASKIGEERTRVYRELLKLADLGIVKKTVKKGVLHFFIKSLEDLETLVDKKITNLTFLENQRKTVFETIRKSRQELQFMPKITIYDGTESVSNIFDDIFKTIKEQKLLTIRLFASNTLQEKRENKTIQSYATNFFDNLKKIGVNVDIFTGSGTLIMEKVEHLRDFEVLKNLPAASSSMSVFLIGTATYIIFYDNAALGVKIEHSLFADIFHLLFDRSSN